MTAPHSRPEIPKNTGENKRFGIVVSRYHAEMTEKLLSGALATLTAHGADEKNIETVWAPGAFEIPLVAHALLSHRKLDAVICLGVILKGETPHNDYIASEVARGIAALSRGSGTPVLFGVLTPNTLEQAKERAGGSKGNKGVEAAEAALAMIQTMDTIKKGDEKNSKNVGFGQR